MVVGVYLLCAIASVVCALLLLRSYTNQRTGLLLWSTLCFVGLALNNVLLFVDLVMVPELDMQLVRTGTALGGIVLMLIGLLWEDS